MVMMVQVLRKFGCAEAFNKTFDWPCSNLHFAKLLLVHKGDKWIKKENIIECSVMTATKGE
jgi:hypothetical protein